MSQERLRVLIHEQTSAIALLTERLHTHEAIPRILRALALAELTTAQALSILAETVERTIDPEQQAPYQQAIAALRQMQAEEP